MGVLDVVHGSSVGVGHQGCSDGYFLQWYQYAATMRKIVKEGEDDDCTMYQCQKLKKFSGAVSFYSSKHEEYACAVAKCIKSRLSWSDMDLMWDIIFMLSTHGWKKALEENNDMAAIDRLDPTTGCWCWNCQRVLLRTHQNREICGLRVHFTTTVTKHHKKIVIYVNFPPILTRTYKQRDLKDKTLSWRMKHITHNTKSGLQRAIPKASVMFLKLFCAKVMAWYEKANMLMSLSSWSLIILLISATFTMCYTW